MQDCQMKAFGHSANSKEIKFIICNTPFEVYAKCSCNLQHIVKKSYIHRNEHLRAENNKEHMKIFFSLISY